jgi:peptidoglycan hydrolase CwlO-like protein
MFVKGFVRYAVIAGLVGGTTLLIAGPERLGALFSQAKGSINTKIDTLIDDPVALRHTLKNLEAEYPQRLESVRRDLAEVQGQRTQLTRELEVARRVTDLSRADAEQIQELIARAEDVRQQEAAAGLAMINVSENPSSRAQPAPGKLIRVVFDNQSLSIDDAYAKATQVRQVHNSYVGRASDIERDLGYLDQQEQRLASLLEQIQGEYNDFQTQVWTLDRQVDTIARNDRLIAMMERREKTIAEQSRYSAGSLDHVQGRFSDIRAKQEARLKTLGNAAATTNYEDRANYDLDGKVGRSLPELKAAEPKPSVIEIRPDDAQGVKVTKTTARFGS